MKHLGRMIRGILAIVALMLILSPAAPARADGDVTDEPVLFVGGIEVTANNQDDILQDGGTATYDPATGTLTFNNPAFDEGLGSAIYARNLNLTINGDVKAEGTTFGIFVEGGTLSIGNGNVSAKGEIAIRADDLVINGGIVTAVNIPGSQNQNVAVYANNITVNDGEVSATATGANCNGMYASNDVSILAGKVTVNSTGVGTSTDSYGIFCGNKLNIDSGDVEVFVTSSGDVLSTAYGLLARDTINVSGGTVKVESNNDYNARPIFGDTVMSGGDVTLTATGYYATGIYFSSLMLTDGKLHITATGTEDCNAIDTDFAVTVMGGELVAQATSKHPSAVSAASGILISGGKVTATATGESADALVCYNYFSSGAQIIINGGEVTATGTGSGSFGIYSTQPIAISGGKIVCNGSNYGIYSDKSITIDNGIESVAADGSEKAIYTHSTIALGNELTVTKPKNGTLNADSNTIVDSNSNVSKSVIIANEHKYKVAVNNTEHGKVTSNRTKANAGDVVALTVSPDAGCLLTSISATDAGGQEVALTQTDDGYTFNMPESNVVVAATFDYDWGDPSYEWADDYSTVTATRVCKEDDTVVETETAEATSQVTKPATCTQKGETTYTSVEFENEAFAVQQITVENVDALNHNWGEWTVTNQPTITEEGLKTRICNNDASHVDTEAIPKIDLSTMAFLAQLTNKGKTSLVLTWNKVEGAEGYDIFFVRCGNTFGKKTKTIKGNERFTWTKKGLNKQSAYKAVVKAYVTVDGKKTYVKTSPTVHAYTSGGTKSYTNVQGVTVKKTSVSLKAGKTHTIKASVTKLNQNKKLMPSGHGSQLRYVSSNKKVAKVSKTGVITAKAKGSCTIYAIAINGACQAIDVTVRR